MSEPKAKYWFPARRYGLGWGFPTAWQGWVVLIAFPALLFSGMGLLLPVAMRSSLGNVAFIAYMITLNVAFIVIFWWKGEPLRWRWGDRESE